MKLTKKKLLSIVTEFRKGLLQKNAPRPRLLDLKND